MRIEVDVDRLTSALQRLFESAIQAEYDFCGEQREWHLPRLNDAYTGLVGLFPREAVEALKRAKTPYGGFACKAGEEAAAGRSS